MQAVFVLLRAVGAVVGLVDYRVQWGMEVWRGSSLPAGVLPADWLVELILNENIIKYFVQYSR